MTPADKLAMDRSIDPVWIERSLMAEVARIRERPGLIDALLDYFFIVELQEAVDFPTMEQHNRMVMRRREARERVWDLR